MLLIDLYRSARSFVRTPALTLPLLLTIALGTGSNVCIHGFAQELRTGGVPASVMERTVSVFARQGKDNWAPLSYEEFGALRANSSSFEWVGAARLSSGALELASRPSIVPTAKVTPELAALFGLPLGDGIAISHRMWVDEFNRDAGVVGRAVTLDGVKRRVAAIAPEWLEGVYRDRPVDVWMPLKAADRGARDYWVLGRLRRPGVVELVPARTHAAQYTGAAPDGADGIARVSLLLTIASGAVFFVACGNVASILLGRAASRGQETVLRVALGAGRWPIVQQLIADSLVISVAGGACGVLLGVWTSSVLPALLFEQDAAHLVFATDRAGIAAAAAVCIAITLLCGLAPVLMIPYDRPAAVLRRDTSDAAKAFRRMRTGVACAQMASCCMLAVSTAFLVDGLRTAMETGAARRLGEPILASVSANSLSGMHYFEGVETAAKSVAGVKPAAWSSQSPGGQPAWRWFRIEPPRIELRDVTLDLEYFTKATLPLFDLTPKAGRLFGFADRGCSVAVVNSAAAAELFGTDTPGRELQGPARFPVDVIGVLETKRPQRPAIYYYADPDRPVPAAIPRATFRAPVHTELKRVEMATIAVSPPFFDATGALVMDGKLFAAGCRTGVVNQEANELYFGGKATGATVIDDRGARTEIAGVVRVPPLGTFQGHVPPTVYFPMSQDIALRMTLILASREASDSTVAEVERQIDAVPGRTLPPVVKSLATHLRQTSLAPLRIATLITSASAAMALALGVLGLFGALTDAARQRRRELAVRIALGARQRHVIAQVWIEGARLALAGTAAGVPGALLVLRLLRPVTPAASAPALWVWLAAPAVLAAAVMMASLLPARRALMLNPVTILREDT